VPDRRIVVQPVCLLGSETSISQWDQSGVLTVPPTLK
jgi:hypothetical protein